MPFITREDGIRFVIPSYRDIISVKKAAILKREILLLSSSYGEYIAMQQKNKVQLEVAFSPETGYLLGECVWDYFKRPYDMIYCEVIPNTSEAILVIVKSGSVYLDGTFPLDSISEELVIFKTQQTNFDIYVYGDVPISETHELGKFTFETKSVKNFTTLADPVFATLPAIETFQLKPVDVVLQKFGIGVLPVRTLATILAILVVGYVIYYYVTAEKVSIRTTFIPVSNPFTAYFAQLNNPDPAAEVRQIQQAILRLYTLPGWVPRQINYTPGTPGRLRALVSSVGGSVELLNAWASRNNAPMEIDKNSFAVTLLVFTRMRPNTDTISPVMDVIANAYDAVSFLGPSTKVSIGQQNDKGVFKEIIFTMDIPASSPLLLPIYGDTMRGLPIVLQSATFSNDNGLISGNLTFRAVGN